VLYIDGDKGELAHDVHGGGGVMHCEERLPSGAHGAVKGCDLRCCVTNESNTVRI
jgi:hypothetical protein